MNNTSHREELVLSGIDDLLLLGVSYSVFAAWCLLWGVWCLAL